MINVRYRPVPAQAAIAEKAQEVAKELAEQSADVAKAGLEGLKAGVDAAIKAYKENRNK